MTTTKDRSMATGPYPRKMGASRPVVVETTWCAGAYRTHTTGYHAVIVLSDDTEVACCNSPHGHKKQATLVACATRKVAKLNDAAGIPEAVR
jgi:hypothetical protein